MATMTVNLHISVIDERPSPRSFQRIIQEILQFSVAGAFLCRSGSSCGDAGPASAEDAAPLMGAVRSRNEQRPIPAGLRSSRIQSHKADFVFLLAFFSWVDPAVQRLLHHSKGEPTLTRSCSCPCSGDTSPPLWGVCSFCCCCCRPPPHTHTHPWLTIL